jgi:hypothetical protein
MALYVVGPYKLFHYVMWFGFDFSKPLWYKDHRFVILRDNAVRVRTVMVI